MKNPKKIKTPLIKGVIGHLQGIQIVHPKKYRRIPKKNLMNLFSVICPSSNLCPSKGKCPHRGPHDHQDSCGGIFSALKDTPLCKPCISYQDFKNKPQSKFRENIRQLQILTSPSVKGKKKKRKLRKNY